MILVRYATQDDIKAIQGGMVHATMRAVVAVDGEEILGYAGIARRPAHWEAFSQIFEPIPDVTVGRVVKMFEIMASKVNGLILAQADPDIPGAAQFLERIGFKREGGNYRWVKKQAVS